MGKMIQRKKFDHPQLAAMAADGFRKFDPSAPGAKTTAEIREIDGAYWLYVTTEGFLVDEMQDFLLPEYERVD
ncbi:hypothetical protein [Sphingomonas koreensis]